MVSKEREIWVFEVFGFIVFWHAFVDYEERFMKGFLNDLRKEMHVCEKSLEMVSVVLRTKRPKLLTGD